MNGIRKITEHAEFDGNRVRQLTTILRNSVSRANGGADGVRPEVLEEALAVAAETEQYLAEQEDRISRLESLLVTDELTGLLNRRGLKDQLERTLAMVERHGGRGVIAYIDLDNFKAINDRLGHAGGDAALKRVAEILSANTRTGDVIARVGGDEFVVLLVQSGWRWGQVRARQIQRMINRSFARYGDDRIPLRASIGVEVYRSGDDAEELLRRADEAMYTDKRDRVTLVHIAAAKLLKSREPGTAVVGV
jgi:diguanylate cyclase (GGDEF)-like protein